jgi:hypothetical protein
MCPPSLLFPRVAFLLREDVADFAAGDLVHLVAADGNQPTDISMIDRRGYRLRLFRWLESL